MIRLTLAPIALLVWPMLADADTQTFPPLEYRSVRQYPGCPGGPAKAHPAEAIDISAPADDALLDKAWRSGVRVVIRYYDWAEVDGLDHPGQCVLGGRTAFNKRFDLNWKPGPTLPAKTLTRDEIKRLQAKGFSIGIVFQHCNQRLTTFLDKTRAAYDADRTIELATTLAQPKGTTIFFAADFDAAPTHIGRIKTYFRTVAAAMKRHGYRIGGYGNGYVCSQLKADKLISSCWLSQSTGFLGSHAYQARDDWDVQQCATRAPFKGSSVHFDANVINAREKSIVWWRPQ